MVRYPRDGLLVYFGYPLVHEDDAQRAVRAGLGIVEAYRAIGAGGAALRAGGSPSAEAAQTGELLGTVPSTLELLSLLGDHGPTVRILTLLTLRPDFRNWTERHPLGPMALATTWRREGCSARH